MQCIAVNPFLGGGQHGTEKQGPRIARSLALALPCLASPCTALHSALLHCPRALSAGHLPTEGTLSRVVVSEPAKPACQRIAPRGPAHDLF